MLVRRDCWVGCKGRWDLDRTRSWAERSCPLINNRLPSTNRYSNDSASSQWDQHRSNTFQGKTLKTAGVSPRRSVENSVLFEEIKEEGLRGWEFDQRNMEEYVPVSWPRACHITRNLRSTNLSKAQCGRILKNWTWRRVQRYPGKDTITSTSFHSQCFPFTFIPNETPLLSLSHHSFPYNLPHASKFSTVDLCPSHANRSNVSES